MSRHLALTLPPPPRPRRPPRPSSHPPRAAPCCTNAGAPVSCWRTLLAANEWNELQTLRLTYPCFTLIMMVSCSGKGLGRGDD